MDFLVTQSAQGDQILFGIVAEFTALRQMMYVQVFR
jgi:hypothetical protein